MNPPRTGSHAAEQNEPISIITLRIIAPPPSSSSPKTLQFRPGLLFLAMFTLGRNFRRFNGTWAIVHSLLYGTLPSFPQKGEERPICLKWTQNKRVYVAVRTSRVSGGPQAGCLFHRLHFHLAPLTGSSTASKD